jgi:hypothetical protein
MGEVGTVRHRGVKDVKMFLEFIRRDRGIYAIDD